ncbi:MAG: site-specific DNA-methyltransferase [Bacteroidetes bacterium]|nr:site-specific DNA-methyltransferase [Bacteroidota bacterium]
MLIKGDNLLVLRSLVEMFKGRPDKEKVKCIYIDPPFNTGNAFEKYEDNLRHSEWLTMMRDRLYLLKKLLRKDGVILVHIDDEELAYLKVLMDEVFGRDKYLNTITVKMSEASGVKMSHATKRLPKLKEYILIYKGSEFKFLASDMRPLEKWNPEYKVFLENFTNKDRQVIAELQQKEENNLEDVAEVNKIFAKVKLVSVQQKIRDLKIKDESNWKFDNAWRIIQAVGSSSVKNYALKQKKLDQEIGALLSARNFLYFYLVKFDKKSKSPRVQVLFADDNLMTNTGDLWLDIKTTGGIGNEGEVYFPNGKKPEALLHRILKICTESGDLVFDSFSGSGTTGAVAHKMGRRWLMVEMGRQADELIIPRMQRVITGKDRTGISKDVNWGGGSGFKYYQLGESVIREQDMNWTLKAEEMAEAVFLHFQYRPTESGWLKKENMYLGKHQSARYHFAISFASREVKTLTADVYEKIVAELEKEKFKHLTIFTNVAVSVPPEALDDRVMVKKIPAAILREYNLL